MPLEPPLVGATSHECDILADIFPGKGVDGRRETGRVPGACWRAPAFLTQARRVSASPLSPVKPERPGCSRAGPWFRTICCKLLVCASVKTGGLCMRCVELVGSEKTNSLSVGGGGEAEAASLAPHAEQPGTS
eukprot:scaffold162244_cov32-Tisochrysis_lutea.AAC.2